AEVWLPILKGSAWLPHRLSAYAAAVPSATSRNENRMLPPPAPLDATAAASMLPAQTGTAEDSDCAGASAPAGGPVGGSTGGGLPCLTTVGATARPTAVGPMTSTRRTSAITHLRSRPSNGRHRLRGIATGALSGVRHPAFSSARNEAPGAAAGTRSQHERGR